MNHTLQLRRPRARSRPSAGPATVPRALATALVVLGAACTSDNITDSVGGKELGVEAAAIAQPPGQNAAKVTLSYSSLTFGPPGTTAQVTARAFGADGTEWTGVTIRWWKSSTSAFSLSQTECASPCNVTLSTSSTGSGRIIVRHYGGVARDTMPVTVVATNTPPPAPGPGDPPPNDPPPNDPPPNDPPPGNPPNLTRGCPTNGYLRLVNVDTDAEISSALSNAQPGDQIRIAKGTYSGNRSLTRSGTAANPLVICGVPGAAPVLKGGQFKSTASYLVLTGLVFEGAAAAESTNNVYLNNAHHVTFSGNEIRGGHYHAGLSTDEVHHMVITYNYIHDNGHDTSHDHGIYFKTTTGPGNLISNNLLVRNAARGLSLHDNSGAGVFDVLVTHNTVVGNGSTGILVNDGDRMTLANNIAAHNGDKTSQRQIRILAGNNNKAFNNVTFHPTASRAGIENSTASQLARNVIGDPRFVSLPGDLHLQAQSAAIDKGDPSFPAGPDYDGKTRGSSPDAGAFEK
jgi:parallel beta helix pectate lyase-like protein